MIDEVAAKLSELQAAQLRLVELLAQVPFYLLSVSVLCVHLFCASSGHTEIPENIHCKPFAGGSQGHDPSKHGGGRAGAGNHVPIPCAFPKHDV